MIPSIQTLQAPWVHGWHHAKAMIYSDKATEVAHRCFCDRWSTEPATLMDRVKHFIAVIALWFPIVNYISEYVFKLLAIQEAPKKPEASGSAPQLDPKQNTNNQKPNPINQSPAHQKIEGKMNFGEWEEQLNPILSDFVRKIKQMVQDSADREASPFYNQYIEELFKVSPEQNPKAKFQLLASTIQKLIFEDYGLSNELIAYVAYRLWNEFSLTLLQKCVVQKDRWDVMEVPGDGNCMIWSIIFSLKVIDSDRPNETFQDLARYKVERSSHPRHNELREAMETLRNQIGTHCADLLNNPANVDLRRRFVYYVLGNGEVRSAVLAGENEEELLQSGIPTPAMIERYGQFVMMTEKWNGEFEAEIVALIIKRPIVMLRGSSAGQMPLGTIAGGQYLENSDANPIVLRHNIMHYDCLF